MFTLQSPGFESSPGDASEVWKKGTERLASTGVGRRAGGPGPSLALVDISPVARDYVHWLVAEISPQQNAARRGRAPGVQASSKSAYIGPSRRLGRTIAIHAVRAEH